MRKFCLLLLMVAAIFGNLNAQSKVSGIVKDTLENKFPQNAVVSLLTQSDTLLVAYTRVQENGVYELPNVAPGKYTMLVTHPTYADYTEDIEVTDSQLSLPLIAITPRAKLLESIILHSSGAIRVRGDTTIFAADSFKVAANANVEELLKKIPSLSVSKDGTITAMGQTVQKVLVDGEEFFGDDPGMAVKNLRADAVKEVQVFDKKSEQAEFTGIDDGKTQKTINLKLKEDKKKGYFGKLELAGGPKPMANIDPRYNTNLMASSFKGKRKISGFFLTGNTGQDGLNWQEEQKYAGESDNIEFMDEDGGIMIFGGGRSSDGEAYINPQNGFLTNINAGLQFSNSYGDKHKINVSPRYNKQDYVNDVETFSSTLFGNNVLNTNSKQTTNINRYNEKLRGIYEVKLDSFTTLKVNGSANFYHTETDYETERFTTGEKAADLKNSSTSRDQNAYDKQALAANADLKRRFRKDRRTLSLSANWNTLSNDGLGFLKSNNIDYFNDITQVVDQQFDRERNTTNIRAALNYTEPLSKNWSVLFGYALSNNSGLNKQVVHSFDNVTGKYQTMVDSLTNEFDQNISQQTPSLKFNYATKKIKMNLGGGAAITNFNLKDVTYNKNYDRKYMNYFPSLNFTYTYKTSSYLRFNYNGSTNQPTIDQLQPLRNNNNLFAQYLGNPDLKPSFVNRFSLGHNQFNMMKDLYHYVDLSYSFTDNAITNSRVIDAGSGKTISQPINTDGNYGAYLWGGMGAKIKKWDMRYGFNVNATVSHYAEILNRNKTSINNNDFGFGFNLNKMKEDKYEIGMWNNASYNINKIESNNTKYKYWNYNLNLNANYYIKKLWMFGVENQVNGRQKTERLEGYLINLTKLRMEKYFREKEFTAFATVNDLFNNNRSVESNFWGNTFTENRYTRIKRYFMVGFRWDFKNKNTPSK